MSEKHAVTARNHSNEIITMASKRACLVEYGGLILICDYFFFFLLFLQVFRKREESHVAIR